MSQPPANSTNADPLGGEPRCLFQTLVIVGVGLLGGSVALAAKRRGIVERVVGVGRNAARLEQARVAGVINEACTDLGQAIHRADLVLVATPVDQIVAGVREAKAMSEALITDVGSTKAHICRTLDDDGDQPDGAHFIGSHPLAGSEKQGWEHAEADLFEGRVCVVTPTELSPRPAIARLTEFWQSLGMTVIEMSPEAHDRAVAQTSHVPHVVASALARTLADENHLLAATGFADTTRIAAGDPDVWVPILLDNRDAVLNGLDDFTSQIAAFRDAIARGDRNEVRRLWEHGKAIREQLKVRRAAE